MEGEEIRFQLNVTLSWLEEACPNSAVALVECDREWRVVHANATALQLAHLPTDEPRPMEEFFPDAGVRELMRELGQRGGEGTTATGEVELRMGQDGESIPARITVAPGRSAIGGAGGYLVIIRSSHAERVSAKIDEQMQDAKNAADILKVLAVETKRVILNDGFAASFLSEDVSHSRVLLEHPGPFLAGGRRWFKIPPEHRAAVRTGELTHRPLSEIVDHSNSGGIRHLVREGFRYILRQPVESEGRIIGSVMLFTKKERGFSTYEIELFRRLPLAKALVAATLMLKGDELRFRLDLLKQISTCKKDVDLFSTLVKELHRHYEWTRISVYTVDKIAGQMILRSQAGESAVEVGYSQPFDVGILGHVFKNGLDVNCGDVNDDPECREIVHFAEDRRHESELCMGIRSKENLYALLDVQDIRKNAFSPDEEKGLRELLDDIGEAMETRRRAIVAEAALNSTPTAVFIVDPFGIIRRANAAAYAIVKAAEADLIGKPIGSLVADKSMRPDFALASRPIPIGPLEILTAKGETLRVEVGGAELGATNDLRMIVFRDLSLRENAEQLDTFANVTSELMARVSTPLSIAGMQLDELRSLVSMDRVEYGRALLGMNNKLQKLSQGAVGRMYDQFERIENVLGDWQFTASAVGRLPQRRRRINMNRLLQEILEVLPERERTCVGLSAPAGVTFINVDAPAFVFAVKSILTYLLCISPEDAQVVSVDIKTSGAELTLLAKNGAEKAGELRIVRAQERYAQAEKVIKRFAAEHSGRYERAGESGLEKIELILPWEEGPHA